ncbi:RteC protein [Pricia antarctica]|uniref:RteC protein n=1 Tax=Pricia antarctica TaxID=641691 RepID=A0A1G7HHM3_9FLAO|nr:RteC domain-containing protein [Pricia antarctica]SDE99826.1 RteC protein [Pricia antarctica]
MPYKELLSDFEKRLKELQRAASSPLKEAMAGIQICNTALSDFREAVAEHGFKNREAEIHFFKNVKSGPLRFLIYFTEVRSCEMKMPKWGLKSKLEFIEAEINRINSFFDHNLDFQLYMENGGSEKDEGYFTRKHLKDQPLTTSYPYFRDPLFNTSHDELWAMVKGFGLYGNFLGKLKVQLTDTANQTPSSLETPHPPFRFTMPPTAAMEFIYAFKELRAFNHGNFDIKPFTDYFCQVFGIEIKDPYGLFVQITNRKTKRAKYIQMLLDAFLNSLERRDGYS